MHAPKSIVTALALLVTCLVVLAPAPAEALSCLEPSSTLRAPEDGAVDVPLNALVWIGHHYVYRFEPAILLDQEGAEVPSEPHVLESNGADYWIIVPDEPLDASTTYQVVLDDDVLSTFTTGEHWLEGPPPAPEVGEELSRTNSGSSLSMGCAVVSVRLEVFHEGLLAVADIGGEAKLSPALASGSVSEVLEDFESYIGRGCCYTTYSEAQGGGTTEVRYGAFDIAGNFSGWGEPVTITFPYRLAPSCAVGSTSQSPLGTVLVLLLGLGVVRAGRAIRRAG